VSVTAGSCVINVTPINDPPEPQAMTIPINAPLSIAGKAAPQG
jgi:hypothetical protein